MASATEEVHRHPCPRQALGLPAPPQRRPPRGRCGETHTVFSRKHVLVRHQLLHGAHDEVDVLGGRALHLLTPLVIPVVLSVGTEASPGVSPRRPRPWPWGVGPAAVRSWRCAGGRQWQRCGRRRAPVPEPLGKELWGPGAACDKGSVCTDSKQRPGRKTCLDTCGGHSGQLHVLRVASHSPLHRNARPCHTEGAAGGSLTAVPSPPAARAGTATSRQPGPHPENPDPLQEPGGTSGPGEQGPDKQGNNPQVTGARAFGDRDTLSGPLTVSVRP